MGRELVIAVASDLHIEFHADEGATLAAEMDPSGVDVLVLAGDIAVGDGITDALGLFCRRFADSDVVYVHGNHEHYGTRRDDVMRATERALARNANLHFLDGTLEVIRGHRFVGGTLWFRDDPRAARYRANLNDFLVVPDFVPWVYEECTRTIAFLEQTLAPGDVVVTHHLPSPACVARKWAKSPLNAFFVCDVEELLRARRPALWVHGHTHESVDTTVGETRVVCNPFGYATEKLNGAFDATFRVRVPA
jgi:predicted phosphodiesterase